MRLLIEQGADGRVVVAEVVHRVVVVADGGDAEHDAVPVADVVIELVDRGVVDDAAGPVGAVEVVGAVDGAGLFGQRVVAEDVLGDAVDAVGRDDVAGQRLILEESAGGRSAAEGIVDLVRRSRVSAVRRSRRCARPAVGTVATMPPAVPPEATDFTQL